jgi:transposase InsO family protein
VPEEVSEAVIKLALEQPARSPRELATAFTDQRGYFVSESTVYRLLKARDLITSPALILMQATDRFSQPSTAINQLWQTDFTCLKVIGWGWFYLSTVLDNYSRYILAWKLCSTMTARDLSNTLELSLQAAGLDQAPARYRSRLLSDNGPSYVSSELGEWLQAQGMCHTRGKHYQPMTQGKIGRYHRSMKNHVLPGELLSAGGPGSRAGGIRRLL